MIYAALYDTFYYFGYIYIFKLPNKDWEVEEHNHEPFVH